MKTIREMADSPYFAAFKQDLSRAADDLEKAESLSKALAKELMGLQSDPTFSAAGRQLRAALSRCAAVLGRQANNIAVSRAEVHAALNEANSVLYDHTVHELAAKAIGEELHKANCVPQTCNVCGCTLNCDAEYASGMCMAHANEGFLKL